MDNSKNTYGADFISANNASELQSTIYRDLFDISTWIRDVKPSLSQMELLLVHPWICSSSDFPILVNSAFGHPAAAAKNVSHSQIL